MKKNEKVALLILLVMLVLISCFLFYVKKNTKIDDVKQSDVKMVNTDIILLSDNEKNKCIQKLIKYLNKKAYYKCSSIEFYNNTFDEKNNSKYFYALIVGNDRSLIEITNLGDGDFKYEYIGNQLTTNNKSSVTGVSYLQIVDPDGYENEQELDDIKKNAEQALPDDTEMP